MYAHVTEWLNLAIRWIHLIAGISWIGNSFYFMWMDSTLAASDKKRDDVDGELWMVHGGGFYRVEKRIIRPGGMPDILHWFKWEATFTWLSGVSLLALIYYTANGIYLLDPAVSSITFPVAVSLAVGMLIASWFLYDLLMESSLAKKSLLAVNAILIPTTVAMIYWLCHTFSGRAAYIHVGAVMGSIMVLNVWVRILPRQKLMIAATERGEKPNLEYGKNAKRRSTHNSYITLPVLFMMLSNHYPMLYGHAHNWILLILLIIVGAGIRHIMLKGKPALWAAVPVLASLAALMVMTATPKGAQQVSSVSQEGPAVPFTEVKAIVQARCHQCHSAKPADMTFGVLPGGVSFDDEANIPRYAPRILERVVVTKTMPLANKTQITDAERATLARWIAQNQNSQSKTGEADTNASP